MNLSNYENYMNEALSKEEIAERKKMALSSHMRMYISKKLEDVLKTMVSVVAKNLLSLPKKNVKFDTSYMDISEEDGMVTYISTTKALKLGVDPSKKSPPNSEVWTASQRNQPARIGKTVGKLFKGKFSEVQIEDFNNEFRAKSKNQDDKMRVVYGEEIRKYYHENIYSREGGGTLSTSCMRNADKQHFFDLYCKNTPEDSAFSHVGLLILLNDDKKLIGRAIVWFNSVKPEPGKVFMDRIYYSKDSDQITFKEYAKRNGWIYKQAQTYNNLAYVDPLDNSKHTLTIAYRLKNNSYNKYPFMDTLLYYTPETGRISSKPNKNRKYKTLKIQDQYGGSQQV